MKKGIVILMTMVMIIGLTVLPACAKSKAVKIGLSFSDFELERWPMEQVIMTKLAQKKGAMAVQLLSKALKLGHSKDADLLVLLGQAQKVSRHVDDAYDAFRRALRVDDGHPMALLELGRIAILDGEYDIAIQHTHTAPAQLSRVAAERAVCDH